jgi:hypothetical protein
MSFDLAVWQDTGNDDTPPSDSEAREIYLQLCNGVCDERPVAPGIEEFYNELTHRYPEIDQVPEEDVDDCPWSALLDRSSRHVTMSVVWSRADEIRSVVFELAKRYSLVLFDPQKGQVLLPPRPAKKRWFSLS